MSPKYVYLYCINFKNQDITKGYRNRVLNIPLLSFTYVQQDNSVLFIVKLKATINHHIQKMILGKAQCTFIYILV